MEPPLASLVGMAPPIIYELEDYETSIGRADDNDIVSDTAEPTRNSVAATWPCVCCRCCVVGGGGCVCTHVLRRRLVRTGADDVKVCEQSPRKGRHPPDGVPRECVVFFVSSRCLLLWCCVCWLPGAMGRM